jgi:hypothetical protein
MAMSDTYRAGNKNPQNVYRRMLNGSERFVAVVIDPADSARFIAALNAADDAERRLAFEKARADDWAGRVAELREFIATKLDDRLLAPTATEAFERFVNDPDWDGDEDGYIIACLCGWSDHGDTDSLAGSALDHCQERHVLGDG